MEAPSGGVLGFSDPRQVTETALFSFNPLIYLYFTLAFFVVPYPFYRFIASNRGWELNGKSGARHWSDILLGLSYGLILFVFGNYTHAFSWITVVAFYPALFAYGWIAELSFAKYSLPGIKHWPIGMWILFLTTLAIILAFAAFHIYWAVLQSTTFVAYYVCALLIPLFFFTLSLMIIKEANSNWARTKWYRLRYRRALRLSSSDPESAETSSPPVDPSSSPDTDQNLTATTLPPPEFVPYAIQLDLHLHHWQIFYTLAFFTRFTHPISQVAAGIVMACYMEGICAYGYDVLVNEKR